MQGEAARHSNVDVDMTSLSPGNDGEEPPSESQEWETGTNEMEESEDHGCDLEVTEDASDSDSFDLVIVDQQPGFGAVKGAAKKNPCLLQVANQKRMTTGWNFFHHPLHKKLAMMSGTQVVAC